MTIGYLTFVTRTRTMGFDYDTPVLVIHTDTAREISHLPFVEQILREDGATAITPIARGTSAIANPQRGSEPRDHRLAPVPVSDMWLQVMRGEYDRRAKVIMVLEPVNDTGTAPSDELPVTGFAPDAPLPHWLAAVFTEELRIANQDVPVVSDFQNTIVAFPHVFRSVEEWAGTQR
ncbi:hypothetical protein [Saccharothrix syringae]|uniref:Uncharacterized protein n=1 Tax=Saccharothrix syringae TaxID=103733 RepID=A0A5Q0H2L2_SACSY|nr:hypothetical protein [Saccharothrix syringae]QFZ20466.1 hypothetical protein EKG83_26365 [Saccharothrix syringae]